MENLPRIVFLDIDGPIINTPCFFLDVNASVCRTVLNTQALGYVAKILESVNAKLVTNSTHNIYDIEDPLTAEKRNLKTDLIRWGLKPEHFHEVWKTAYPYPEYSKGESNRLISILQWQEENGPCDWIAFDDEHFTKQARLILVSELYGIDYEAYLKALKFWKINEKDYNE